MSYPKLKGDTGLSLAENIFGQTCIYSSSETLTAEVTETGRRTVLRLVSWKKRHQTLGIPENRHTKLIINSMIREGLPLNPDKILAIAKYLSKKSEDSSFISRIAAAMLKKGIEPKDDLLDSFIPILEGKRHRHGSKERERGKSYREQLKEAVKAEDSSDDGLTLFNRIAKELPSWFTAL